MLQNKYNRRISGLERKTDFTWSFDISTQIKKFCERISTELHYIDFSNIKEKELYGMVKSINSKKDIFLEDIQWIYRDYDNLEDVMDGLEFDFSFLKTRLSNYVKQIIYSDNIEKREKVVILLAHMEKMIEECLGESLGNNGIKTKIKNAIDPVLDIVSEKNIARCYIWAITNIIFARTDDFKHEIDKRIPFRNYILHNGIYRYKDNEIVTMYFVLVAFIRVLLISGSVIQK